MKRRSDNPEVYVIDGNIEAAIRLLKVRSGVYGTMRVLRLRRDHPGRGERKRAKAIMAKDRSKRMLGRGR